MQNKLDSMPAYSSDLGFCQVKDLHVHIMDLGLIHADACYDAWFVSAGRALLLQEHIDRFNKGLALYRIPVDESVNVINIVEQLLTHTSDPLGEYIVWMIRTRGRTESGSPIDLLNTTPKTFFYLKPFFSLKKETLSVCIANTVRRVPDVAINQRVKNFAWQDLTLGQLEAVDRGYDVGVVLSTDGFVSEGAGFGICCYRDKVIYAPAKNCLESTTIRAVSKVAHKLGWGFEYSDLTADDFNNADGAMLLSCAGNCNQVTQFENVIYDVRHYLADTLNTIIDQTPELFTPIL